MVRRRRRGAEGRRRHRRARRAAGLAGLTDASAAPGWPGTAADQVDRLERAMVTGRAWTRAEFEAHLFGHPLLVAEDRTFADVHDDPFTPPDDAEIRVAHPLHPGDTLPAPTVLRLVNRGWRRLAPQDGGVDWAWPSRCPAGGTSSWTSTPASSSATSRPWATRPCATSGWPGARPGRTPGGDRAVPFGDLDPVSYGELVADLEVPAR
ncbi:DUF4132 domain-containing protein [Saccharothrix sp. Mg75]|uniref:DUF4132 domain-containing protein n=1 Tax=Saccharothrix sp. Mg75 TaxID=3445357 RepID=UPI003EED1534